MNLAPEKFLSNSSMIVRDHRYKRPNFPRQAATMKLLKIISQEKGLEHPLALFAEFAIGNVMYPHLAVGAPFAMDIKYMNNSGKDA